MTAAMFAPSRRNSHVRSVWKIHSRIHVALKDAAVLLRRLLRELPVSGHDDVRIALQPAAEHPDVKRQLLTVSF